MYLKSVGDYFLCFFKFPFGGIPVGDVGQLVSIQIKLSVFCFWADGEFFLPIFINFVHHRLHGLTQIFILYFSNLC